MPNWRHKTQIGSVGISILDPDTPENILDPDPNYDMDPGSAKLTKVNQIFSLKKKYI